MKKRIVCAVLTASLIVCAASCGNSKPAETKTTSASSSAAAQEQPAAAAVKTADEIANAVLAEIPINSAKDKSKDKLPDYFDGLNIDAIEDSAFYICASGAYPDELAVLRFDTEDNAKAAVSAVKARLSEQTETYKDYTPEEAYKLEDAVVKQSGVWVYYLVTSDNSKADGIVSGMIG